MKVNVLMLYEKLDVSSVVWEEYRAYIYHLHHTHTLDEAVQRMEQYQYSLVVIEAVPALECAANPIVVLRSITNTPIMVLLRNRCKEDFMRCLETADDCIREPFDTDEVVARAAALIMHGKKGPATKPREKHIYCRGLLIDPNTHTVRVNGKEVDFTSKEYDLLLYLAQNPGHLLSHEKIYTHVWKEDTLLDYENAVSGQVYNIRKKLADKTNEEYIANVWGRGYRFHEIWPEK